MRRRQKVVAEATGFVIRRRHGGAMPPPHALPEAPSTALLSSLFSIRQPYKPIDFLRRLSSEQEITLYKEEKMTKILALDLEGSLISNAMSQLPRPGLYDFLTLCFERFDGVVLYTAVRATKAREILCSLVDEGLAPPAFATMSIVQWNPRETRKELRRVCELFPGSSLRSVRIVDDDEDWIVEAEREFWFPIAYWESPYSEDDRALFGMMDTLHEWYLS